MLFHEINPFVRQAIVGRLNKSDVRDIHTKIKTVDARLFYIISGSGRMTIEKESFPLVAGTVILFSAGTEYVWETEDVKYYVVNFDYTHDFSDITTTFHPFHSSVFQDSQIIQRPYFDDMDCLQHPIVIKNTSGLERMIEQLTTESCIKAAHADMLLTALLKSVIVCTVRAYAEEKNKEKTATGLIRNIVEFINANYENEITNEIISETFHFNSIYLNRIFKKHLGVTLHEFVISRRIAAAMEMLRSQNIPICAVAQKCGFNSIHHFTKTFRKRAQMSPKEYRNYGA